MKNNGLAALEPLVGQWEYTMYNAWFLESMSTKVKGFTTIERLDGSFVVVRNSSANKKPEDIWVVYDELDLPLGNMKIRFGGATAGHHGLDSILNSLGTDKFWRFRMGIGKSHGHNEIAKHQVSGAEIVLKGFTGSDKSKARQMFKRGSKALQAALEKGIESAQNQFNTK